MTRRRQRTGLGLVIAMAVLLAGGAGTAYAADPGGGAVRADGTRVTSASPQPGTARDSGNDGAWVVGVGYCGDIDVKGDCWTWINTSTGTPCPPGHFCIYTNTLAAQGGKVFSFFHCRNGGSDWALRGWNGTGLYHNSNTGGAHAYLKGFGHNVLRTLAPGDSGPYNFVPVYYVQAC